MSSDHERSVSRIQDELAMERENEHEIERMCTTSAEDVSVERARLRREKTRARDEAALEQAEAAREHAAGEAARDRRASDALFGAVATATELAARGEKMIAEGKVERGSLVRHPTGDHPQEIGQVCDICAPEGYEGQVFVSWPWGSTWQYAARLEVLTPGAAVYELSRRVFMVCAVRDGWQLRPEIPHHPGDPRHTAAIKRQADAEREAASWPLAQKALETQRDAALNKVKQLEASLDEAQQERARAFGCYEKEVVRRVDLEADLEAARAARDEMDEERTQVVFERNSARAALDHACGQRDEALALQVEADQLEKLAKRDLEAAQASLKVIQRSLDAARAAGHNMQGERDKALEELAQHKVWLEDSQALQANTSKALDAVGELATQMEQERDEARQQGIDQELRLRRVSDECSQEVQDARATLAEVAAARDELARDLAAAKSARTVAETDKASAVHEMRHALRKVEVMMGERDAARELLGEDVQLRKGLERELEQARAALASKPANMFYHQIEAERDTARADLHRAQLHSKTQQATLAIYGESLAVEKARAQDARDEAELARKARVADREELEACHKRMLAAEEAAKRAEADAAEQRQVLIDERNRAARDLAKLRIEVAKLTAALHGEPAAPRDGADEAAQVVALKMICGVCFHPTGSPACEAKHS